MFEVKIDEHVLTLAKLVEFSNILRSSHRNEFFLVTLKKLQFSAKIDFFWVGVDASRCLKAEIAENVIILTNFGDFLTILR